MRRIKDFYKAKRMIFVLFLIFIVLFIGLGFKISSIIFNDNQSYEKRVVAQQIKNKTYSYKIEPKRGSIKDRNGISLAESVKVYNLVYDCKYINKLDQEKIDKITEFLDQNLVEYSKSELEELLREKSESQYQLLLRNQEYEDVEVFATALKNREVNGIGLEERYVRIYPYNNMASDIIGYSNNVGGVYGVESFYNTYLQGEKGRMFGYIDDEVRVNQKEIAPVNGMNIELTIDFTIQKYVEEALSTFSLNHKAKSINAIVMDPTNGDILAMASYPNFDLNNPYDLTHLYESDVLQVISEDEKTDLRYELWKNFLVTTTYEPGSTYKPFVMAAALEEGTIELDDEYYCPSYKIVYDRVIHCWKDYPGHGELTAKEGLQVSCNVVFMEIGEALGKDLYYSYQKSFGFADITNVDVIGEVNSILYPYEALNPVELATSSFGQGFNITPIQLTSGFSALVNGGNLYEPHLMKSVIDENGRIIERNESNLIRQVISRETSAEISLALLDAVGEGTGNKAEVVGYQIGGKTGTAEKGARDNKIYMTSFIGAAPIYNPKLVTLVIIDEPDKDEVESSLAAEVFSEIMEKALLYKKIYPEIIEE